MSPRNRIATLLVAAAAGCTGTDVGNPRIDVDVVAYGDLPPAKSALLPAAPSGTIDAVWVSVDRVRLRAAATCDGDTEIDLEGPFAVDARAPGAIDALSDIEVTGDLYCRFELRWRPYDGDDPAAPAELAGAALLVEGSAGDGTPFILRSERNDELRLDAIDGAGFPISDATGALFVAFDVEALLDGVDLESAEVGTGGVIRIESGSNDELLAIVDDNLAALVELYDDNDADSELDPDERDETDVLAR